MDSITHRSLKKLTTDQVPYGWKSLDVSISETKSPKQFVRTHNVIEMNNLKDLGSQWTIVEIVPSISVQGHEFLPSDMNFAMSRTCFLIAAMFLD
jgi:hypothetical protein